MNHWVELGANTIVTIFCISALVSYRKNRKFKQEKVSGFWDFLDRNIVEGILGMVLVPNLAAAIIKILEIGNGLERLFRAG